MIIGRKKVAVAAIEALASIAQNTDCHECEAACIEQIASIEESWRWGAQVSQILDRARARRQAFFDRLLSRDTTPA